MMYKSKIISFALFALSVNANAGWYANTAHSRANCVGFNESITWNWSEYHWWEVRSTHFKQKGDGPDTHQRIAWMAYTWRSAALDYFTDPAGANLGNYWVQGYHFYLDNDGKKVYDAYTQAGDCAIYDGWWETHKAKGE